jgi:hypothetical protein
VQHAGSSVAGDRAQDRADPVIVNRAVGDRSVDQLSLDFTGLELATGYEWCRQNEARLSRLLRPPAAYAPAQCVSPSLSLAATAGA